MIILYLKETNQFLQAIKGFPEVKEEGNKLLFLDGGVIINDLTKAGHREYPDQKIDIPTEWDEELEMDVELPITLEELNLRVDFTVQDLKAKRDLYAEVDELEGEIAKLKGAAQWQG